MSFELKGKKLSFANWISNLSPTDTFFTSTAGKGQAIHVKHSWQTEALNSVDLNNAVIEGSDAGDADMKPTTELYNTMQILRKVVKVTDTTNATQNYGRGKELAHQMEKAGKEIKRDLEGILLQPAQAMVQGDGSSVAGKMASFGTLCAAKDTPNEDGAITTFDVATAGTLTEEDIFKMTANLYTAGSDANVIMYHPKHASMFASLQERATATGATRGRIFENTTKFVNHVSVIVDPLGREYKCVPNRFMPEENIYFFNPSDWRIMSLRPMKKEQLAKTGSSEKWMIEMELTLEHKNPYASGNLIVGKA